MKNIPQKIFLQTGLKEYGETCEDFKELNDSLISWCSDKIYEDDLEFISVDFILARIKEIEEQIDFTNKSVFKGSMSASKELHRLRGIKKELKNLIK